MNHKKIASALFCVGLALLGVYFKFPWLSIAALVLWFLSIKVFGKGDRSGIQLSDEEIERINNEQ